MPLGKFFRQSWSDVLNVVNYLEREIPVEGDEELELYAQRLKELVPRFEYLLHQDLNNMWGNEIDFYRGYRTFWIKGKGENADSIVSFTRCMKTLLEKHPEFLLMTEENKGFFKKYKLTRLQKKLVNLPLFCKGMHVVKGNFFARILESGVSQIAHTKYFLEAFSYSVRFETAYKSYALLSTMKKVELKAYFLILYMYPKINIHKGLTDYLYARTLLGHN